MKVKGSYFNLSGMSTASLNRVAGVLDAQARRQEKSDQRDPGPLVTELKSWLANWCLLLEAGKVSECFLDAGDAGALARGLEEIKTRVLRWAPEYAGFVEVFEGKLRVVALTDWEDGVVMEHGSQLVLSIVARGHYVMEVTS